MPPEFTKEISDAVSDATLEALEEALREHGLELEKAFLTFKLKDTTQSGTLVAGFTTPGELWSFLMTFSAALAEQSGVEMHVVDLSDIPDADLGDVEFGQTG